MNRRGDVPRSAGETNASAGDASAAWLAASRFRGRKGGQASPACVNGILILRPYLVPMTDAQRRGRTGIASVVPLMLLCGSMLLYACGSSTNAAVTQPHRTPFVAANFVDPTTSTNRWHPLQPGIQWVREGTTNAGSRDVPHQVITTMTDVIRVIDGVKTVAMIDEDTDAGQVREVSIDYLALDKDNNVWILGGYTEHYSGGRFTNSSDAALGRPTSDPGILLAADPQTSTPRWFVGRQSRGAGGAAEVVKKGISKCVPFACYKNVLVIREGPIDAIDNEFKYYAPGVGQILNTPRPDSKGRDVEALVNFVHLSTAGLEEKSNQVLTLETHARITEPKLFGTSAKSVRLG